MEAVQGMPHRGGVDVVAAAVSAVPMELGATSQEPVDDVREQAPTEDVQEQAPAEDVQEPISNSHQCNASPAIRNEEVEAVGELVPDGLEVLLGRDGATESPTAPRSPLCFPTEEATVFPASPASRQVRESNPKSKSPTKRL
jgi:hypothetical protein